MSQSIFFLGDIAVPHDITPPGASIATRFKDHYVVGNLEGPIASPDEIETTDEKLYLSTNHLKSLRDWSLNAVSLANNHVRDDQEAFSRTRSRLQSVGVNAFGAGDTLYEASKPVKEKLNGEDVIFLGFGWSVVQCPQAGPNKPGVNPLTPRHVLGSLRSARKSYPEARIALYFHWNYEMELYPQPMDRQLARMCIDAGANIVVGTHSHRPQGIEFYRDAPIVYGLGNWFLPQGEFFDGRLTYPEPATLQLVAEWIPPRNELITHWFRYQPSDHTIAYLASSKASDCERVADLTPFNNMSSTEYVNWFKGNRTKRRFLPVYKAPTHLLRNYFKDRWIDLRAAGIKLLVNTGFKDIGRR